jgi:hypothetical protein
MRFLSLLVFISLCCFSCTKKTEESENLVTDSKTVHLGSARNSIDSLTIDINGNWTITSDSAVSWLQFSSTSGNGSTKIYVKSLQTNNFSLDRKANFTVTTDNSTEELTIDVVQDKFIFSPWAKLFGGTKQDMLLDIINAPDGGFVCAGRSLSSDGNVAVNNGDSDMWVVKIDAAGNIEWEKSFGNAGWNDAGKIVSTDYGYAIFGTTVLEGNQIGNSWIVKIDQNGSKLWEKTYVDPIGQIYTAPTGGFFCTGTKNDDAMLTRLDSDGNIAWTKSYGGANFDRTTGLDFTSDGGLIIVGNTGYPQSGTTQDYMHLDPWILKLDENGNVLWEKLQGTAGLEWTYRVVATDDGGAIIQSSTEDSDIPSYHGFYDILLTKVDANGNVEWHKAYGSSQFDFCQSMIKSDDGVIFSAQIGTVLDGDFSETFGETDAWVVKVDGNGNIVWQKVFGGTGIDVFTGLTIADNKLVMTGHSVSTNAEFSANHGDIDGWVKAIDLP